MKKTDIKICIGVSTNRGVKSKTVESLVGIVKDCRYDIHLVMATDGVTICENRTYIVHEARKARCSHILFVDDDMVFKADTLGRLIAQNKQIVGVDAHMKVLPIHTTVKFMDEDGKYIPPHELSNDFTMPTELFKCHAVGTGLMLVETSVFEEIEMPWFQFELSEAGFVLVGEDIWFCRQAQKKGIDVWCDPTIEIKHIGDYLY